MFYLFSQVFASCSFVCVCMCGCAAFVHRVTGYEKRTVRVGIFVYTAIFKR